MGENNSKLLKRQKFRKNIAAQKAQTPVIRILQHQSTFNPSTAILMGFERKCHSYK